MKDAKFIELLNLYVDQQIDAADAALLEEEISRNPVRRRTYQQYCRIHRACSVLFEQSYPQASLGGKLAAAAAAVEDKVIDFPESRRRPWRTVYWGGMAAAAAACVAFVAVRRPAVEATTSFVPQGEQVVHIAPLPATQAPNVDQRPVLVTRNVQFDQTRAEFVNLSHDRALLEWVNQVQLTPLNVNANEFVFETRSSAREIQTFQNRHPMHGTVEKAAFQFQR